MGDHVAGVYPTRPAMPRIGREFTDDPISCGTIPASVSNAGIAGIVPCHRRHEILFGPELEALRTKNQ